MPKPEPSKGAPKWAVTFADLSTLLMTFFVLLLSFANLDIQKFRDLLGSIQGAFGVQMKERGSFRATVDETQTQKPKTQDRVSQLQSRPAAAAQAQAEARESEEMAREVEEVVRQANLGDMASVTASQRGVRVRVKGGLLFEPGSATLRPEAKTFLDGVTRVLNKSKFFLVVEGHTDNLPIHTAAFPSNWELSAARATAVVRQLAESGVSPTRLSAIGFGANYPLASNDTADGRQQNRRVEFIFTRISPRVAEY